MNHSIITRFTAGIRHSMLALAVLAVGSSYALAQDAHSHMLQMDPITPVQSTSASTLLKIVRDSTARFKDVNAAIAEGYALQFGCVSGSDSGAMGLHYVNGDLVNSGISRPDASSDRHL